MRRALQVLGLSGFLLTGFVSTHAFAEEPTDAPDTDADSHHNTEEPKQAEQPAPVLEPGAATGTPTAAPLAPPPAAVPPVAKPKFGDVSVTGYFRGGFGAGNQKGRMTCFQLALPGGLLSKYRLGNECEVWSETHFAMVTYVGEDGVGRNLALHADRLHTDDLCWLHPDRGHQFAARFHDLDRRDSVLSQSLR